MCSLVWDFLSVSIEKQAPGPGLRIPGQKLAKAVLNIISHVTQAENSLRLRGYFVGISGDAWRTPLISDANATRLGNHCYSYCYSYSGHINCTAGCYTPTLGQWAHHVRDTPRASLAGRCNMIVHRGKNQLISHRRPDCTIFATAVHHPGLYSSTFIHVVHSPMPKGSRQFCTYHPSYPWGTPQQWPFAISVSKKFLDPSMTIILNMAFHQCVRNRYVQGIAKTALE